MRTPVTSKIAGLVRNTAPAAWLRSVVPERYRPIGYVTGLVRERTADRVRSGPFAGMHYVGPAIGSAYLPKLLGSYERELAPAIEAVCAKRPSLIINLGAAEGYYAVGLARRNPQARVFAFEQQPAGRAALKIASLLNGVSSRIKIAGCCRPADLELALSCAYRRAQASPVPAFVLSDVEGDEDLLMDPARVLGLKSATLLVETHDFVHPGIADTLKARFAATHRVELIPQQPRSGAEFPFKTCWTSCLPRSYLEWALSEWRPAQMNWLWMVPRETATV